MAVTAQPYELYGGTPFDGAADVPEIGAGASLPALLKGILLELKLIRGALTDDDLEVFARAPRGHVAADNPPAGAS